MLTQVADGSAGKPVERKRARRRPDPVVGVGMVIVGVLVMGVGGAATWHYVFNVGTLVAIVGALVFVINVTISTLREDKELPGEPGSPLTE